jgi:hypothetical protein
MRAVFAKKMNPREKRKRIFADLAKTYANVTSIDSLHFVNDSFNNITHQLVIHS